MRIHFIGIGGIGISALAQYYLAQGYQVSGSDLASSEITESLRKKGAKIFIGHRKSNLSNNIDLVLITPAVKTNNPELKEAKKRGIKIQTWEKNLGQLTKEYQTIAVSGAHGKSTTTSMIALVLVKAGLDPTVIVGTKLKEFNNSNFRMGKGKYLVIEADEYKSSFLNYWPKIIVLTNLEYEHPDYFKNFNHYLDVFKKYISHLGKDGILVINKDDKNSSKLKAQISKLQLKTQNYSLKQTEAKEIKKVLKIPGQHNVADALAALIVARILKIPEKKIFKAFSEYQGAWRRFEIHKVKLNKKNITIVSDYGHHPTQVKATIAAAKEKFPKRKIWIAYQAHQYLRTYYLFNDYVKAFDQADEIILPEIYAVSGREKKEIMKKFSAQDLVSVIEKRFKKMKKKSQVHFLKNYQEIPDFLRNRVKNNDVLILMGAGDIYKLIPFKNGNH